MGSVRSAVRRVVVALFVAGVLVGGASSGTAASPAITFTLDCSPGMVTPGGEWGCTGTIANNGPQTATHVTLVQEIPGATLVASSFEAGTCEDLVDGGASCELGNFANGEVLSFTTVFDELPPTGTAVNDAYVRFDERANDGPDTGKQDTVCANAGEPPCTPTESTTLVAAADQKDKAGGHVAFVDGVSDALGTSGTPSAVGDVLTELLVPFRESHPFGFGATIDEAIDPVGDMCPAGGECFGQTVIEDLAGQFADDEPVVATFRLIAPNGVKTEDIVVYHNGVATPSCALSPLSGTVDTCVQSRSKNNQTKVVTLVVWSTDNGSYDFGF